MLIGIAYALAAGLMWGVTFIVPLLLPEYPPALLAFARYGTFGAFSIVLAAAGSAGIRDLRRADWIEALKLGAVGNVAYYVLIVSAIQSVGAPLPTVIVGTLPVVIAIAAVFADKAGDALAVARRLAPSLVAIAAGVALVNHDEFARIGGSGIANYLAGAAFAVAAVACWTWYPLRNARWLRDNAGMSPRTWTTAQGMAIFPISLVGFLAFSFMPALAEPAFDPPLGPRPLLFVGLTLATGILSSWVASLCWNAASRRLSTAFAGQLIVFETLAALAYAYLLRGGWPEPWTVAGIVLLVVGIGWATRAESTSAA